MRLKRIRKKVNKSIHKYGTTNPRSIETGKIIDQICVEQLEEEYRIKSNNLYQNSLKALEHVTIQLNKFPSVEQWNHYAMEHGWYSSISLEYISGMSWNKIRTKVYKEINQITKRATKENKKKEKDKK